jgi:glycosyltransferase involved in cell wall biosynthesis
LALQNERFSKKETDLDKSFKKSLFKRYSVRDVEPVNSFCVVVSTFNQADSSQIRRTLNSIVNQKYADYKVVLVDQMSTDRTLDLVQDFIQEHENFADSIKVIPASKHKTQVEATLEGLLSCGKEDIAVLMSGSD